jgi:hypothetical protein
MMKTWKEFCESREGNIRAVNGVLNQLCYGLGLDMDQIANMDLGELASLIQTNGLLPSDSFNPNRFAGMVKMMARGTV